METGRSYSNHVTPEEYAYGGLEELDRLLVGGVEKPISSTSIGSKLWRDLGARRVVKITMPQAHVGKERSYSKLNPSEQLRLLQNLQL